MEIKKEPISKRVFDFSFSLLGIVISLPLWFIIALAILLDDGLPVFYFKKSVGKGGKIFSAIKFRSMISFADEKTQMLSLSKEDFRLTRVGKLLRPTALDELPQLINILKGEMSFVGPRSYAIEKYGVPKEVAEIKEEMLFPDKAEFFQRNAVTPGLTGMEQVALVKVYKHKIGEPTGKQILDHDLFYIKNQSFCLDLKLIFQSFIITFKHNWEIPGKKFWVNKSIL